MPNGSGITIHFPKALFKTLPQRGALPPNLSSLSPWAAEQVFLQLLCCFLFVCGVFMGGVSLTCMDEPRHPETSPCSPTQQPPSHACLKPRVCLGLPRPGGEVLPPLDSLLGAHRFPAQHRDMLQWRGAGSSASLVLGEAGCVHYRGSHTFTLARQSKPSVNGCIAL